MSCPTAESELKWFCSVILLINGFCLDILIGKVGCGRPGRGLTPTSQAAASLNRSASVLCEQEGELREICDSHDSGRIDIGFLCSKAVRTFR
jgi:hypothetical protein